MQISKGRRLLNKAKKYINLFTLVILYHSFIYSYLTYSLEVWGGAGDVHLLSLFKLQKRVVGIIKSLPHRAIYHLSIIQTVDFIIYVQIYSWLYTQIV